MKHLITFTLIFLAFAGYGQKKEKITYDSTGKVLYITREITEAIDTAKLYSRLAAVNSVIQRKQAERDTILSQIKTARKLMTRNKGGGNGNNKNGNGNNTKKSDIQPPEPIVSPTPVKQKKPAKKGGKNGKN